MSPEEYLDTVYTSSQNVRALMNYMASLGFDVEAIKQRFEISDEEIHDQNARFKASLFYRLLCEGERLTEDNYFAFRYGSSMNSDRWGLMGHIASFSSDCNEAMQYLQRYKMLAGNIGAVNFSEQGDNVFVEWQTGAPLPYQLVEDAIANWIAFGRSLAPQVKGSLVGIYFSHEKHGDDRLRSV